MPEVGVARGRGRLVIVLAAALAGLAVLAAVLALTGGSDAGDDGAPAAGGSYRGTEPARRSLLPAFELRSYRGRRVASSDLQGQVVLLTLLDSQCTESCPIIASVVARTIDRLGPEERARVRAVAVSVDPAEDTAAAVRRFLRARRAHGRLDYLVGPESALRPLWRALQILPSVDTGSDDVHSAPVRIYDRTGVWVTTLHAGADLSEENLLHDIRRAL